MLIDRKQLRILIRNAINEAADAQDAESNNTLEFPDGSKISVQNGKVRQNGKEISDVTQALKLIADKIKAGIENEDEALTFAGSLMQNAPANMKSYLLSNRFIQSAKI